ncbi:hypothetical protein F5Y10DRAFT_253764 [Nemania abortiva]|nr:hypothetical protein F5Y10DRAFT_253764 [Nemania abortiva]
MEEFIIDLFEIPDHGVDAQFRNRNDKGQNLPQVLIDEGNRWQAKAKLMSGIHGTLRQGGDPASLLIFEFDLTHHDTQFKSATIKITFEDGTGPSAFDPEVYNISPRGFCALDRKTDSKEVTHGADAAINANPISAIGLNLAYHWTMSGNTQKSHFATLNGMSRRVKGTGEETRAMWVMKEDPVEHGGIPTFLRTAVVLRHDPNDCCEFRFSLEIDAQESKSFFYGKSKQSRMHNPYELDPKILAAAKMEGVNTEEIAAIPLDAEFIVRMARDLAC